MKRLTRCCSYCSLYQLIKIENAFITWEGVKHPNISLSLSARTSKSQLFGYSSVKFMKDIYLYMSDCCCYWQRIQKDKYRFLLQEKHDNDARSLERHISRYLTNTETRIVRNILQWHSFCDIRCSIVYLTLVVSVLTAVAAGSAVSFVLSFGAVSCPITQLIHGDTQARGWTGPFSWVTLSRHIIWGQNQFIIFVCEGLHIGKGKQKSFKCVRLLGIKRYSVGEVCIRDGQPPQECGADLKKIVTKTSLSGKLLSL